MTLNKHNEKTCINLNLGKNTNGAYYGKTSFEKYEVRGERDNTTGKIKLVR